MADTAAVAAEVIRALDSRTEIEPFTTRDGDFDAAAAYAVTAALRQRRGARGERQVGRKIGFTNRNIWAEYGVYEPIWGDVYSTTARDVTKGQTVRISHLPQPRVEAEIILGIERDLEPGLSLEEIAARIGWIAHGFEIVQSIFPNWQCSVADCIADGGLHGALFVGPRKPLFSAERSCLLPVLSAVTITLSRNGEPIDTGIGSNVLDGPLQALKYLTDVLASDTANPPVKAGELVTTGTITRAFPAAAGERWTTTLTGYDLPGMDVVFS